ncbi:unnamed protein product [Rhodiola kirilowii]
MSSCCYGSTVAPLTQPQLQLLLLHQNLSKIRQTESPSRLSFHLHQFHNRRLVSCRGGRGLIGVEQSDNETREEEEEGVEVLACGNGWRVRRMAEDQTEMIMVAQVQAEAFHEPVFFMDDMFFHFFQAEVLAALLYRLRNSSPDRYACLIAEPEASKSGLQGEIVGVVDLTVSRDDDVLQHVQGEEYLYVSGIAVSNKFRRQKVATTLLEACEVVSTLWGFKFLALRAYECDLVARTLYANAGYRVVSGDPHWKTTWIGRKRRVLMIKQSSDLL